MTLRTCQECVVTAEGVSRCSSSVHSPMRRSAGIRGSGRQPRNSTADLLQTPWVPSSFHRTFNVGVLFTTL